MQAPAWAAVALVVLVAVSPGLSGAIAPHGTFSDMARQWKQAGAWLSERAGDGRALVVPAASFGEYEWGRTIDEPIRPLSSADYAVRDAVPLTPAGTIRVLDAFEQRLQTGRDVGGAVDVLRRTRVRYLVLRNDLDTATAGQPSVAYARSAIRSTPGIRLAKGFGLTRLDASGERVFPVEVYDLGTAAPLAVTEPVADVVAVSGGPEDLLPVADAGIGGLAVLDGDRVPGVDPGQRVVTDGYRARERWFGATRGRDTSSTLAADELAGTRDYRPWDDLARHSVTAFTGIAGVDASSSLATDLTLAGLRPADRPAAVLDGDPTTAWVTQFDPAPTLTVRLDRARSVPTVRVRVLTDEDRYPGLGVPTRLAVRTDAGEVRADVPASGVVEVALPDGPTGSVAVEVLDTDEDDPASVLTGLASVDLPGVAVTESVVGPSDRSEPAGTVLLSGGLPGSDACVHPEDAVVCFGGGGRDPEGGALLSRRFTAQGGGRYDATGTLDVSRWADTVPGLATPGVTVAASSSRTTAVAARPDAVVDGDERTAWSPALEDTSPTLTVTLDEPADVQAVTLSARRGWMARYRPFVRVRLDGREQLVRASADGRLAVQGKGVRRISATLLPLPGRKRLAAAALEVEELTLAGHDLPRPAARVTRPCGGGPVLEVDGSAVPTRLDGPRSALWGQGDLEWVACAPARLAPGPTHDVVVRGDEAFRPAAVRLRSSAPGTQASGPGALTPVPLSTDSPTHLTGPVAAGPQRLLALAMNTNAGWEATLDGAALTPVVVDGFRQGFVLPAGASGRVDVTFAPDAPYRLALGAGFVLALLLLVAAVVPDRSRRVDPPAGDPGPGARPALVAGGTLLFALVVAGPWAALAAGLALLALRLRRTDADWPVALAVVVLLGAAGVAGRRHRAPPAALSRGWRRPSRWPSSRQECSPVRHPSCRPAHRGAFDGDVAQPRQEQADRQAHGEQRHDAAGEHPCPGQGIEPGEHRQVPQEQSVRHRPRRCGPAGRRALRCIASSRPSTSGASSRPATAVDSASRADSCTPATGPRVSSPAMGVVASTNAAPASTRQPTLSRASRRAAIAHRLSGRSSSSASTMPTAKFGHRAGSQRSMSTSSPIVPTVTNASATVASTALPTRSSTGRSGSRRRARSSSQTTSGSTM